MVIFVLTQVDLWQFFVRYMDPIQESEEGVHPLFSGVAREKIVFLVLIQADL